MIIHCYDDSSFLKSNFGVLQRSSHKAKTDLLSTWNTSSLKLGLELILEKCILIYCIALYEMHFKFHIKRIKQIAQADTKSGSLSELMLCVA